MDWWVVNWVGNISLLGLVGWLGHIDWLTLYPQTKFSNAQGPVLSNDQQGSLILAEIPLEEVHCLQQMICIDFPNCSISEKFIIPKEDLYIPYSQNFVKQSPRASCAIKWSTVICFIGWNCLIFKKFIVWKDVLYWCQVLWEQSSGIGLIGQNHWISGTSSNNQGPVLSNRHQVSSVLFVWHLVVLCNGRLSWTMIASLIDSCQKETLWYLTDMVRIRVGVCY